MPTRAVDGSPSPWRTAYIWWQRLGRDILMAAAIGIAALAVSKAIDATDRADHAVKIAEVQVRNLARESNDRRDQACTIFERQERSDLAALKQTYGYLAGLSRSELHEPLNRAILANLSQVELAAQTPDAPGYCHKKGVGLPEPRGGLKTKRGLLVIPNRPSNLPPRR